MQRVIGVLFAMCLITSAARSEQLDPVAKRLESDLQVLKQQYEAAVQAKKNDAIKEYEAQLRQAMQRSDLEAVNRIQAQIAVLKGEPAPQEEAPVADSKITGDWTLENAAGLMMSAMRIDKIGENRFELIRIGGGAFAVCGEYEFGKQRELVKIKKPNDAYWDTRWRYFNGKLTIKDGQYKNWTLRRDK